MCSLCLFCVPCPSPQVYVSGHVERACCRCLVKWVDLADLTRQDEPRSLAQLQKFLRDLEEAESKAAVKEVKKAFSCHGEPAIMGFAGLAGVAG